MFTKFCDNTRNTYLASCLYDCIEDNNIHAIKKLLENNGANPNIILPDRGITPFHLAVGSGVEATAEEITKLFLISGGNPNISSNEKLTPVHIAAAWGRLNVLNILLKCGGDPTLADEEGKTPLDYAKEEKHWNIVEYLENYLLDFVHETRCDKLSYDITLNKLIIKNGAIVAEYGVTNDLSKHLTLNLDENDKISYVTNWCIKHANYNEPKIDKSFNCIDDKKNNSVHNISSEESNKEYSRESGILTISSDSSFEDIFNKCVIINSSNENIKQDSNSEYLTCNSVNTLEKNITNSIVASDKPNEISQQQNTNIPCQLSVNRESDTDSFVSITEEYKYIDKDEGIVLIEKRILVNPRTDDNKSVTSVSSKVSTLPSFLDYDTDTLRHELASRGEPAGPITKTTKRVYLRKLHRLKKNPVLDFATQENINTRIYSVELEKTLRNPNWTKDLSSYKTLEQSVANQFNNPEPSKRWREGLTKASFTYLLLDPRITNNLPGRCTDLAQEDLWRTFLGAIFYVGKGKRSRPYSHLYEAVTYWKKGSSPKSKKVDYILNIWKDQFGVVCLHIFQNVIPVEAYTREAAMINALKLKNLCNSKTGDFYGISATWPEKQKRLLGVYLLYRAMQIFLNEGERQLHPDDIGK